MVRLINPIKALSLMHAVTIKDVSKRFGVIKALDHVSLEVRKGEILGLLGPNGAGKTTMMAILTGILTKDSGSVNVLGMNLDTDIFVIKARINSVSGFSGIYAQLTIQEFLWYYAKLYNADTKIIPKLMKLTEIEKRKHELVNSLSSGFKQRVLFARALLNNPDLLLLDEPTVGLDVEIALKVRDLILSLKKKGKTILFTSHNLLEVEQLCDRIALINKGKILAIGTIPEIKRMLNAKLVVEIKCQHPSAAKKAIGSLGKIRNEEQYVLVVELKKENPKELLDRLIDADVGLESYRVLEPTLEEAFIKLVRQ